MKILLDNQAFLGAVRSLGKQILSKHPALNNVAIIGIQQGGVVLADVLVKFLEEQLKPELLEDAARKAGQKLTLRRQEGYDHSYFFMATFVADHVAFHAARLA